MGFKFQGCLNHGESDLASTRRNVLCSDQPPGGRNGLPALEGSVTFFAGEGFSGGATLWLGSCSWHSGIAGEGRSAERLGYRSLEGPLYSCDYLISLDSPWQKQ